MDMLRSLTIYLDKVERMIMPPTGGQGQGRQDNDGGIQANLQEEISKKDI